MILTSCMKVSIAISMKIKHIVLPNIDNTRIEKYHKCRNDYNTQGLSESHILIS